MPAPEYQQINQPVPGVPRDAARQPQAGRLRPDPGTAGEGPMIRREQAPRPAMGGAGRRSQDDFAHPSGAFRDPSGRAARRPAPRLGAAVAVVETVEPLVGGTHRIA